MVDCAPLPAQITFKQITVQPVDIYRQVPPPGNNIPVFIEPFQVEDLIPTEDEIQWAVGRI